MSASSVLRRAALAGALALSLTGLTAGLETAQAMPAAATLAPASDASGLTTVKYMYRRHYRRHRHAGLYNCGRGALHTHLERKACGVTGPSRQFLYRR